MRISNMTSSNGNKVANQFLLTEHGGIMGNFTKRETFQSYDSVIARRTIWDVPATERHEVRIELDRNYWDYSTTTGKYRNRFLGENKAETLKKIKSGEYKLTDLNK